MEGPITDADIQEIVTHIKSLPRIIIDVSLVIFM